MKLFTSTWLLLPLLATPALSLTAAVDSQEKVQKKTARKVMEDALDGVSRVLLDDSLKDSLKRDRIKSIIDDNVDFPVVARLVLARNYRDFSAGQTKAFIELFRKHLLQTYWNNAEYADFQGMEVTGDRKEQRRDWTVLSRVKLKNSDDLIVNYRLRQDKDEEGGAWHIIDIQIEGVSLVSNFRSQFQSILSNDGPDKLIELLKAKVEEGEKAEAKKDEG